VLEDWNAHKIPFFSVPPAVHPSSVPSTVHTGGGASAVAPGAEHVGEARIVDAGLGAAFKLDGLFEGADRGAFEDAPMDADADADDAEMDADLDAEDGLPVMDGVEDGVPMESDDLAHIVPRKRSRSPTPTVTAADPPPFRERMPKRLRRNPARDDALGIGRAVGAAQRAKKERKTVGKKDRRRERRAAALEAGIGGMEVDEGLEGTFMMTA
jgi:nuclear GTP-binding protein